MAYRNVGNYYSPSTLGGKMAAPVTLWRNSTTASDRLFEDIQASLKRTAALLGAKIDLSKCFDRISFGQAIRLLEKLGAPPGLCAVLRSFYAGKRTWFEVGGYAQKRQCEAL